MSEMVEWEEHGYVFIVQSAHGRNARHWKFQLEPFVVCKQAGLLGGGCLLNTRKEITFPRILLYQASLIFLV